MENPQVVSNPAPKLAELRVRAVRVPMAEPHQTASGAVAESPLVLTDAVFDDGLVGHSVVFTYTPMALQPVAELVRNFAALIKGESLAPAEIEQKLARRFRLLGTQGLVGMALAAIDMALWDALARSHRTSLARLLGGVEKPVPAYGAVGYDGEHTLGAGGRSWAKRGFTGVKAKIGYPTVAGGRRSHPRDAKRRRRRRCDHGRLQPVPDARRSRAADARARRRGAHLGRGAHARARLRGPRAVAREAATPIQCGENWWGALDFSHAVDAHASDYVMPDVMKIGGVTGWLRAAAIAQAKGIRVSNHLWPEISAQLLCVTPTAHWLEYADWWNPVMKEPLAIERGMTRRRRHDRFRRRVERSRGAEVLRLMMAAGASSESRRCASGSST